MAKNKKDILFLCQFFYPEHNSSATLPFDLASGLANEGFAVRAFCGYPKEYAEEKSYPMKENVDGVEINRIKYLQANRKRKLGRLINYFSFSLRMMLKIPAMRNYKCIIVYSNPPILPIVAVIANILFKTKIVFVSFDVYPEIAIFTGAIGANSMIAKGMRFINNLLFKRASKVVALTDEMADFLMENRKGIKRENIVTIENWAHEKAPAIDKESALVNLGYDKNDFVVSYLGNMGICQDMETLLRAIDMLKDEKNIHFIFAGHGVKKAIVEERTADNEQVKVMGFLQGQDFENVLAASSCCVLSLERNMKGLGAPSKLYSYLQAGKPVIAITDKESYLKKDIDRDKIGFCIEIGNSEEIRDKFIKLKKDCSLKKEYERNAKVINEKKYKKDTQVGKYMELFASLF